MARVQLHRTAQWDCAQSHFQHAPELPCRMILCGPSGCGKSRLLLSLLLDIWVTPAGRSCFERIVLFSPSHGVGSTWKPLAS